MPILYATQEKVSAGFEAAGKKFNDIDGDMKYIKENLIRLSDHFRNAYYSSAFSETEQRGFWGSEAKAKMFGEVVLAALGRKDAGENIPSSGGFLTPEMLMLRFIDQLGRFGKFRKNALVLPMESASALMPKMESDLTVICPGEGKDMDKSDVGFSQIRLTPKTWCALAKVSTELSEDSVVALGEIIGMSIARSMARKEDLVGFVGDGTETYFGMKGIVGAFHSISSTISEIAGLVVGTGNAYSELVLSDFQLVVGLLPEQYDETAKWFMSKKFYYNVVWRIAQSAGVANIFEILSDKKSKYFLGYEVEFVHSMPSTAANSQICAVLGDLQAGAYLAERRSLLIEQSRDAYFGSNQLGIRGTERIDINCFGVGDKTNPGSIVGLITAAS
jgi:HK97 family phage major capsid protein